MFSAFLSGLKHSVTLRLAAWHAAIFIITFGAFFLVVDLTLSKSLRRNDLILVDTESKEISEEYGEGGTAAVARFARSENPSSDLIRLASSTNRTLFVSSSARRDVVSMLEQGPSGQLRRRMSVTARDGDLFQIQATSLPDGNVLQVGLNSHSRQLFLSHFRRICGAIIFPMAALGICGGVLFARRTLRPVNNLSVMVAQILRTGKLTERVASQKAPGELMELVHSFNQMLGRIETLVGSMRVSLDNVTHELRTPMTRLRAAAETALRNPDDTALAQNALVECVEESERIVSLLSTLTDIAEAEAGSMKLYLQPIDLAHLARKVGDLYNSVAEDKTISISVRVPEGLILNGDANRLPQAVANLVDNALKYTPSGGQIIISGWTKDDEVALSVEDTGVGISHFDSEKIWERLYRGDKNRSERGLGLGLTLVKAIVEAHRGRVTVQSEPSQGSVFTLYLPVG